MLSWNKVEWSWTKKQLVSGLTLTFYDFTHFLNHSLGLISMEKGRRIFNLFWRNSMMYWVAPFASLIHICLSVGLLLWRKTLKRLNKQVSRLWYRYKLSSLRLYDWGTASFLVVNDCFRGNCLGLYQWVCLSSNYERWRPYLFAVALLTPTSNILGVNSAVHEAFLN